MANKHRFKTVQSPSREEIDASAIELYRHHGKMLGPEALQVRGAVPKNVLVIGPEDRPARTYIAKGGRRAAHRECVTEGILATIAQQLPIASARFRLVRLPTQGSEADVRFMSEVFLRPGEALVHGVEIAARFLETEPAEIHRVFGLANRSRGEREFYTVDAIVDMLTAFGRTTQECNELIRAFGKMVVFDAFVGVQDRHAENWGAIECSVDPARPLRFAPLYDTARGLFASQDEDYLEAEVRKRGVDGAVQRYAERSFPVFGCRCQDVSKINHFALVEHMVTVLGQHFRGPARQIVGAIDLARIDKALQIRFTRIVTRRRLGLIKEVLRYRHQRMREIVFGSNQ